MLAGLLANLRTAEASYPMHEARGQRPAFWLQAQYPAMFEEAKAKARELKEAVERLRFLPEDHELRQRFETKAAAYRRRPSKPKLQEVREKLDYLEMALDADLTDEMMELAIMLDDEEFFMVFDR